MDVKFKHSDLKLINPPFESKLADFIIELDYLRKKPLGGTTHPSTFFQLKKIFHTLESIGSARIEGNRTTIAEFIETKIEKKETKDEKIIEIQNMEKALAFIDENIDKTIINRMFVSELHKQVVKNLIKEGSKNPGDFRKENVRITKSNHLPPDMSQVPAYMDELFAFINKENSSKYDLLKTALAHHRFAWIHPFDNGNGRTVRLFTYAMLVKQGFNIHIGRIINPTAIFCNNRDKYYKFLSKADTGMEVDLLSWCEYVLEGLKNEIDKIDKLLDYNYLSKNILLPAIDFSLERKLIIPQEEKILKIVIKKQVIQAGDLKNIFPGKIPAEISRTIRKLKDKNMLMPEKEKSRKYVLHFENNYLLRGIIEMLDKNNFLPVSKDK
ncbi:MAG: Fic family protein [Candidatus Pacebacteria bacterium]|nr:Fic family protein [Candidatus Paceibacterota bacterium]